jgi:GTP-dependent phosphoenolpyruvate carboxykinase
MTTARHAFLETGTPVSNNPSILSWVAEIAELASPSSIHWCDGSDAEDQVMREAIVASGAAVWLNPELRPNSLLVRSDPCRRAYLYLFPFKKGCRSDQ